MKRLLLAIIFFQLALTGLHAGGESWLTDYDEALALAKREDKFVFIDFTGSDWCPPCKLIDQNVFAKEAFKKFAARNLVLLMIDFPQRKRQTEELKAENEALADKYAQDIYPTNILLNSEGKEIHRTLGYDDQTVEEYVGNLQKITRRD